MRLSEMLCHSDLLLSPNLVPVIRAGGPGSGCHGPNCGRKGSGAAKAKYTSDGRLDSDQRPMNSRYHNALTNAGYKFKGTGYDGYGRSEGISSYSHRKHGDVDVYRGGLFVHDSGEGYSMSDLKDHLASHN